VTLAKAEQQTGAMVALYPSYEVAQTLSQPGGEPPEELHLTLAFLGEASKLGNLEALATVVAGCAASLPPLTGEIAGIGHFTAGPEPVTYASPDVPGLPEFRQCVSEALAGAGFPPTSDHGFTPHITLAYDHIEPQVPNLALAFNALSLVVAGERLDFPLIGKTASDRSDMAGLKDLFKARGAAPSTDLDPLDKASYSTEERAKLAGEGKAIPVKEGDKIVGGRYPIKTVADLENAISAFGRGKGKPEIKAHIVSRAKGLGATAKLPEGWTTSKTEKAEFTSELWKNDEEQIVYGVVMHPGVYDSQGDVVDAAEIEKAAHRYLAESRLHDVQHAEEQVEAVPVESFIAPCDMEYAGRPVLKGSWVMAVHVADADVWGQVAKGELTGFSIGGTAERNED
jgi:2'-5' RNA ligase